MENSIVFGATGKIGKIITERFLVNNYSVSTLGRRKSEFSEANYFPLDYTDLISCERLLISLLPNANSLIFAHRFRSLIPPTCLRTGFFESLETELTPLFGLHSALQNVKLTHPLNIVLVSSLAAASVSPDTDVSYLALKTSLETFVLNIQSTINSSLIYSNVLRIGEVCIPSQNHILSKLALFKLIRSFTGNKHVVSPSSIADVACILANASSISLNSSILTVDNGLSRISVESILRSQASP